MRILHVNDLTLDTGGGAEIHIRRLRESQQRAGDETFLFTPPRPHTGPARLLDIWDPIAQRALSREIADLRPDVVHVHNVMRELSPAVLRAVHDVPSVATIHDLRPLGGSEHHLPDPRAVVDRAVLAPTLRHLLRAHVDVVIGVSETVAAAARRARLPQPVAVPVPVPAPTTSPTPPATCGDVVVAAKLAPDKGVHIAVAAFARVALQHPKARLVIAGDGPEEDALRRQAAPLKQQISFLGRVAAEDMSQVYATARLVVVPSLPALRPEGASLTAAEAARHGRPVVTSDDPAAAEVGASIGATIVAAGDVDALAAAIGRFLGDGAAADAAGARAATLSMRYDADAVAAQVRTVYLQAMG